MLGALAAAFGGLVYLNALSGPFVYDDLRGIVDNGSIRGLTSLEARLVGDMGRPVLNLSYAVDYAWWGLEPFGYHLTGVLLHVLNVVLLFALGRTAVADANLVAPVPLPPGAAAFVMAALLAVHPMATEAVAYVSGRSEVLCATFFLLALVALRRALVSGGGFWLAAGGALWMLAVGSREVAVVLPLVLLAYDRLLLVGDRSASRRRVRRVHLPLLALAAGVAVARLVMHVRVEPAGPVAPWQYLWMEFGVVWRYLGLLLAPLAQSVVHSVRVVTTPLDPSALAAGAGLVLLAGAAWRVRRRLPLVSFGALWFLAALAPSSSLIPLNEAMAEHRVYLASLGFFLAVVAGLGGLFAQLQTRGFRPGLAPRATLALVLLALATLTVARNLVWTDPLALWLDAARKAPDVWLSHYGLGEALRARGNCAAAVVPYATALRLRPQESLAHTNFGTCLVELGRLGEAREVFLGALVLDPGSPRAHVNLGVVAARAGRVAEARRHFVEALARDPHHVLARRHLALLHETAFGEPAEALRLCREIEAIVPGAADVADCIRRNGGQVGARAATP
jgi:tetratricopeptide (TPR) repeat protein